MENINPLIVKTPLLHHWLPGEKHFYAYMEILAKPNLHYNDNAIIKILPDGYYWEKPWIYVGAFCRQCINFNYLLRSGPRGFKFYNNLHKICCDTFNHEFKKSNNCYFGDNVFYTDYQLEPFKQLEKYDVSRSLYI